MMLAFDLFPVLNRNTQTLLLSQLCDFLVHEGRFKHLSEVGVSQVHDLLWRSGTLHRRVWEREHGVASGEVLQGVPRLLHRLDGVV